MNRKFMKWIKIANKHGEHFQNCCSSKHKLKLQ